MSILAKDSRNKEGNLIHSNIQFSSLFSFLNIESCIFEETKTNNMTTQKTVTDHLNFDEVKNKAMRMIQEDNDRIIGLYAVIAIHTGLRNSDLMCLTWEDVRTWKLEGKMYSKEKKTSKNTERIYHPAIDEALKHFNINQEGYVFTGRKNTGQPLSIQQINRKLKEHFKKKGKKVSSHSLRKTFGRRFWQVHNETESALVTLSQVFNHSSVAITRIYLNIEQEDIDNGFLKL